MLEQHNYKNTSSRAFTLIELIVVVTILAILGSIGFVTMTGYFAGARDSARLSDMNNIYSQLNLTAGMDGTLPYPDNYRALSMSGTTPSNIIIYQGYAAKSVLTTIKFEKGGRDPKDDVYYTYTTDKKKKQAQLMGYFEEYDTSKLSNNTTSSSLYFAEYGSYTDRKIGTLGKNIGTLLESTTLVPVQQTSTGILDITNTSTGYIVYFDSTTTGSGVGSGLKVVFEEESVIYNGNGFGIEGPKNEYSSCSSTGQFLEGLTKYSGCDSFDIILCSGKGQGQTLAACNAGATTAWNGQTFASETANRTPAINSWAGGLYQWGNNADISFASTGSTQPICSVDSTFNSNIFVVGHSDWCSAQTDNIWGNTTNTNIARIGPCSPGYHVPTWEEWFQIYDTYHFGVNKIFREYVSSNMTTYGLSFDAYLSLSNEEYEEKLLEFMNSLDESTRAIVEASILIDSDYPQFISYHNSFLNSIKLPLAGSRNTHDGKMSYQGKFTKYWSSTPETKTGDGESYRTNAHYIGLGSVFSFDGIDIGYALDRSTAISVRCFKN